ncbi:hypothetical protein UAW_01801 [Enterococcus haemoperoxidus ATCC BAA-382]|uniref:WxL domain-containing protein n=1 Tax=Enterococcus haemoperoxidus ATCC BAA-382 TaxID=1158608 RepID=R2SUZ1_9ENTE|nr:WxL domain-containing protein [Enterococcus haemoperoxidus]EOH96636.1 hypothetical protein UAW_01801 [Enterococcus haemoperoxidus ATCC BAA-382]EOT60132.1 hypothetical protein I583_02767 [Enterococcus haemoperoxidus ATCC BAA-382]OJG51465.1 hypothetical protein RV06_GL001606 [Enterococcus haemoperoxidus]
MKKTILVTLLSASAMMLFATSADAKTFGDTTDVGVSFKSDEATIPGENQPFANNISLIWKPGNFEFGEQKAVGASATFNNISTDKQYLVVNDDRQLDSVPAWDLKAQLSDLTATDGTKLTSKLIYTLEDAQSYDIGEVDPNTNDFTPKNPASDSTVLGTLDPDSKIVLAGGKKSMTLEAGQTTAQAAIQKTEANAIKGGVATQIKDIKLVVTDPKADDAAGKAFTGTVNWTLDDLQP